MKFRSYSKSEQLESDWLTVCYVILEMASVAGSSFSVSVRGHISHCNIPQLQGKNYNLSPKLNLNSVFID